MSLLKYGTFLSSCHFGRLSLFNVELVSVPALNGVCLYQKSDHLVINAWQSCIDFMETLQMLLSHQYVLTNEMNSSSQLPVSEVSVINQ